MDRESVSERDDNKLGTLFVDHTLRLSAALSAAREQMIVRLGIDRVAEVRWTDLCFDFVDKDGLLLGRVEVVFEGLTASVKWCVEV